jgi:hypothetical protein
MSTVAAGSLRDTSTVRAGFYHLLDACTLGGDNRIGPTSKAN